MKTAIQIEKPDNWQDFEQLCLELWGELWQIPNDIDFYSTNPQGQDGVDVYGIPKGESMYFGIQCKLKRLENIEGKSARLNFENDVQQEIEKAKKFPHPLKKLIIATTSEKDRIIEDAIARINIEHREKKIFEVQICFWNFIERKIQKHRNVYEWYVRNKNRSAWSIYITFPNNLTEEIIKVPFRKIVKRYTQKILPYNERDLGFLDAIRDMQRQQKLFSSLGGSSKKKINKSVLPFQVKIDNTGGSTLEDWKMKFSFMKGEFSMYEDEEDYSRIVFPKVSDINIDFENRIGELIPFNKNKNLHAGENYLSEIIGLKVPNIKQTIEIGWRLFAKEFVPLEGKLQIIIEPEIVEKYIEIETEDYLKAGKIEESDIGDYIE
jgi:hypothetical protein